MALLPLNRENLEMILRWRNTPGIREKMYTSHMISWEEHVAWFEKIKNSNTQKWFVYHAPSGEPTGVVYFTEISDKNRSAFWAFYAAENSPLGTGSQMEYEALEYVFQERKLHKLNCEVLANNSRVVRLHEKFGFSKEGVFRDFHFDGNEYVDVVRLGILDREWREKRREILHRLEKHSIRSN